MNAEERMTWLIRALQDEAPEYKAYKIPSDFDGQWNLLRSLLNIRPPEPASQEFLNIQDELLKELTAKKGIVNCRDLKSVGRNQKLYLWQGDITVLKCDAIVNAANNQLLGCFIPCHNCIDNIIHTMSGVQLRLACHEIMRRQGYLEKTGTAKITPGYNLPAQYVIHTVGPIVDGMLLKQHKDLLSDCYRACLDLAAENNLKSVAFCCISTGVFRFPKQKAAEIAVETVEKYLAENKNNSIQQVIFNVFSDDNFEIYYNLLK